MNNQVSFQNYGGTSFLIYKLANGETVNKFVNGMITNNDIEGIMPYSVSFGEENIEIKFPVPPMLNLDSLIKKIENIDVFLTVLSSCLSVIAGAAEYLIDASNFILDPQYIYVDSSSLKVKMLCIATDKAQENTVSSFVRNYIYSAVLQSGTHKIAKIHNYLNSNQNVSALQIVSFINEILKDNAVAQSATDNVVYADNQNSSIGNPVPSPQQSDVSVSISAPSQKSASKTKEKGGFSLFKKKPKEQKQQPVLNGIAVPGVKSDRNGISIPGANQSGLSAMNSKPEQKNVESAPVKNCAAPVNSNETVFVGTGQKNQTVLMANDSKPHLLSKNGKSVYITNPNFTIGKSNGGNFRIDYIIANNRVSRFHATITQNGNDFYLIDNASTNGTYVNNTRVASGVNIKLNSGDSIRFADEEFTFIC